MSSVGSSSASGVTDISVSPDALIVGHYGFQNLGDEAILAGMLRLLRQVSPAGRWVVVSGDPEDTLVRHGVLAVDRADIPAVLSAAYRSRMVIVGGGGLLSDQWGFRPEHVLSREAGDIPGYLGPAFAAAAVGRPVLVWGVGVGPFHSGRSRRWVKALAEVSSVFTVRTQEDQSELESLGIVDSQVVGDPAWLIKPDELPADVNEMLSSAVRPLVAVAPRSWGPSGVQAKREQELAEALDIFCEKNGGSVVFVPMQELGSGDFDDRRCCDRMSEQMTANVYVVPPGLNPGQLLTVFGRCDLALNMRLHGTILAAMNRTPSVSVSYDPKVTRMVTELGLGRWSLSDDEGSWARLNESLEEVWRNCPDLSHFMYVQAESMLGKARSFRSSVDKAMAGGMDETPSSGFQAIQKEIALALTRNLSETQTNLDNTKGDNLDLRNRIIRKEDALRSTQDELQLAREELQLAREEVQAAYDQHQFAERRGDLLQLELDDLRQTRAIQMVTKYWRVRSKLRQKAMRLAGKPQSEHPSSSDGPQSPIPDVVTDRIADSRGVVVFLLNIDWYIHLFQRPQQLAQAFARLGYTVIFDNSNQGKPGWEEIEPRLFLYNGPPEVLHLLPDPLVWALTYNWERAADFPEGTRTLYDWIDELDVFDGYDLNKLHGLHDLALSGAAIWPLLPDPLVWALTYNWERAADFPEGTRTLYDWIDELDVFDGYDLNKLHGLHDLALSGAAMTSASARSLLEKASEHRPDTMYLPNAVEFEHFANWEVSSPAHPALQRFLQEGRPIVGYYGAIARWMDYDLLAEVAEKRKDWSFLLIGPAYDQSAKNRPVFTLPNVEWVTAQPYQDLPRWLQSFDVAMIPFVVSEITVSTSPLKLFEYFAGGKPVVCSKMPEVVAFPEVHSYCDAEGMSKALDLALADSKDPELRNRLRRRGEENSWLARARTVAEKIEQGG